MVDMTTPAELAQADQLAAKEREFDRKAQRAALVVLLILLPFMVYGVLAAYGVLPVMPWSPMGKRS